MNYIYCLKAKRVLYKERIPLPKFGTGINESTQCSHSESGYFFAKTTNVKKVFR